MRIFLDVSSIIHIFWHAKTSNSVNSCFFSPCDIIRASSDTSSSTDWQSVASGRSWRVTIVDSFSGAFAGFCYLASRRFHRFSRGIPLKTSSRREQETSSRHWIPGQYERPPHQPQLNSTVSQLCSLRTRGAPSAAGVKSLCIIGSLVSRRLLSRRRFVKEALSESTLSLESERASETERERERERERDSARKEISEEISDWGYRQYRE